MEREIVVRGTGEARALPDQASLRVEVSADHKTQAEAHDARTRLAAAVDEVLSRHADAIARPWARWRGLRSPGLRRDPGRPVPLEAAVAPMAAATLVAGDAEPEHVTPAELTVRVDVEVGFTILDASGTDDLD
jgi:uncharacterized protein YggE